MIEPDTLVLSPVVAVLGGRAFELRFDMRAVFALERAFGSLAVAREMFNSGEYKNATARFFMAAAGSDREAAAVFLREGPVDFTALRAKLLEAVAASFSAPDWLGDTGGDAEMDWDEIYYIARYRLRMGDEEFWGCTPRRFDKLHRLWLKERGVEAGDRLYMGEFAF